MPSETATSDRSASTRFYDWKGYRCAYDVRQSGEGDRHTPLVLIHPIGVGLSRRFWDRFCQDWLQSGYSNPLYVPDLLGCGDSDKPHTAYTPDDWAAQLQEFAATVVQQPAIWVTQGALLPVAIALHQRSPEWIKGLILAGPPAWAIMTQETPTWQQRVLWNLFDSPLGRGFFRYARRRQFLQSFSARQLFADEKEVDAEWLDILQQGADDPATRYAVFSFLAGFWRQDYEQAIANIQQPTLVVVGETASSIGRAGKSETPEQRMSAYLQRLPEGRGVSLSGRNVLPYESTHEFVEAIAPFVTELT